MRRQQRATRGGSEDPEDGGSDPTRGGRVRAAPIGRASSRREQRTPKSEEQRSEGEGVEVIAVRREDGDSGSVVVCGHGGGGRVQGAGGHLEVAWRETKKLDRLLVARGPPQ